MFQNQIGRVQNVSKKTLKSSWMFEYFKLLRLPNLSKISTISTICTINILIFCNGFNKRTISHRWFLFIMYGFGYFYFYTNCISIMIFSTISFSILMHFTENSSFDPCVVLLLNKLGNLVFIPFEICKHPTFVQSLL